jgi:hypothetical protein
MESNFDVTIFGGLIEKWYYVQNKKKAGWEPASSW